MAGVPLLNGFLSKEMFFAQALDVEGPLPQLDRALPYLVTLAGMFSVAYSVRFIHGVFFGPKPTGLSREPQDPAQWVRLPIDLLVLACVVVGIFPAITIGPFLHAAVQAVLGADTPAYSLSVWHGFNLPLLMSSFALAGGVAIYLALRNYFARGIDGAPRIPRIDSRKLFDTALLAASSWARVLERFVGTQRLQPQLRWMLVLAIGVALWPVYRRGLDVALPLAGELDWALALVWTVGAACAIGAAWQAKFHRLVALMLTGVAGLVTCLTFVWFSAPDLALTQLLVEIVTAVLLLLGLRWLPKRVPFEWNLQRFTAALPRRSGDLVIALGAGAGLAVLAYGVMTRPLRETISAFFVTQAYPGGGGTNVVNVILVDFRAFDTFGEITVLGAVALAVYSLLRRFRPARESMELPPQQKLQTARSLRDDLFVPAVITRTIFAVIIALAAYLLLRGHNLPGGGFVAGLTMAVALILQYVTGGTRWIESRLDLRPVRLIGAGLLLAALTGAGAWVFVHPFLTSHVLHFTVPMIGEIHLPSAFAFDLGVFALVIGATTLILIALAHQSVRAHRGESMQ
jgi:multicomponent K+:H+ antiporter subunit A